MRQFSTERNESHHTFHDQFNGRFVSALRWPQLDLLWDTLRADADGWYLYQIGEQLPEEVISSASLLQFTEEVDTLLRTEHDKSYCGIVYADDLSAPSIVKIYDPGNLGASCGSSGKRVLPRWVMSRTRPVEIQDEESVAGSHKGWWMRLLGG